MSGYSCRLHVIEYPPGNADANLHMLMGLLRGYSRKEVLPQYTEVFVAGYFNRRRDLITALQTLSSSGVNASIVIDALIYPAALKPRVESFLRKLEGSTVHLMMVCDIVDLVRG